MSDAPVLDISKLLKMAAISWRGGAEGEGILGKFLNETPDVIKVVDHTKEKAKQPPEPAGAALEPDQEPEAG